MSHVRNIAARLTYASIADRVSVSPAAVSMQISKGMFPASWYVEIKKMCEAEGIECPVNAFNFKSPAPPPTSEAS